MNTALTEKVKFVWLLGKNANSCPGQDVVAKEIVARLHRDVFADDAPRSIETVITSRAGLWIARIDERDGARVLDSREIQSSAADCTAIKEASVLIIMYLIDPPAAASTVPSVPAPASSADELPASRRQPHLLPRSKRPLRSPLPRSPAPLQITLTARSAVRYGLLPGFSPDFGLFVGVGKARWEASMGLSWMPEVKTTTSDGTFAYGLNAAWLGACFHPLRSTRAMLSTCGHVLAGATHSVVVALVDPTAEPVTGEHAWAAVALSPRLRLVLRAPVVVELGVDVTVPLVPFHAQYEPGWPERPRPIFEQLAISASGFFGLGVSFP